MLVNGDYCIFLSCISSALQFSKYFTDIDHGLTVFQILRASSTSLDESFAGI